MKFSGTLTVGGGKPLSGAAGVTFALYEEESGGAPIWMESQNVQVDGSGRYTAMLGATRNEGIPAEVFASGQERWLGVQPQGEAERPRVLLTSVPYALKAVDAETLGGLPASAFLLAGSSPLVLPGSPVAAQPAHSPNTSLSITASAVSPAATTPGYIARFTSTAGALGNSAIYEKGGNIGVGTKTPAATLEVNGNAQVDGGSILASGSAPVIQFPGNGSNNFSAGLGALPPATTGTADTAVGDGALHSNTTGMANTAVGNGTLYLNTSGNGNTAIGDGALDINTTGYSNTAVGNGALYDNTTGFTNTAIGDGALFYNTTGVLNTASGGGALNSNTTGTSNTASGQAALYSNITGSNNTASGAQALFYNTTGSQNTASGQAALYSNTSGGANTASGYQALYANTNGFANTATGNFAMYSITSGCCNTASGAEALFYNTFGCSNVAIGEEALAGNTTGNNNIAIGSLAGSYITTTSNNIEIGNEGTATDNGTIRIGVPFVSGCTSCSTSTFIAGIYGVNTSGTPVYINSNGQLGTVSSSRRYKEDIHDMADASDGLMRLRPVSFRYKKAFDDGSKLIQYGLIAEESTLIL